MNSVTVNLNEMETKVLEELSNRKDLTKSRLMIQALRMYQMIDNELMKGNELAFIRNGEVIRQIPIGIGDLG